MTANPLQPVADTLTTVNGATAAPAGAVVGVQVGDVVQTAVAGRRTIDPDAPMTVHTAHDLASVTKIVATTTSLIRLVSQAELGLDDTVMRHVPWFTGDGRDQVTVRQLLAHRGGLWEWQPLYLTGTDPWEYLARLPLRYRPDSEYHYSDLGFMLLGRIIETVTGQRLADAVRHLVIEPMGLAGVAYARPVGADVAASAYGDAAERRMVATGEPYPVIEPIPEHDWRSGQIVGEVNDGNAFGVFDGVSGHAGLFGQPSDLLRFAYTMAHYGDHTELWRPEVVEQFLAPGPDPGRHLGFRSWEAGGVTVYGHPGFVGCVVGFAPQTGASVAMCTNRLLTRGTPTPNEELWSTTLRALPAVAGHPAAANLGREES